MADRNFKSRPPAWRPPPQHLEAAAAYIIGSICQMMAMSLSLSPSLTHISQVPQPTRASPHPYQHHVCRRCCRLCLCDKFQIGCKNLHFVIDWSMSIVHRKIAQIALPSSADFELVSNFFVPPCSDRRDAQMLKPILCPFCLPCQPFSNISISPQ